MNGCPESSALNYEQEQAVRVSGHCLITAPPGSGKTKVLEQKAAFLLRNFPGTRVLGVTFTTEAAAELETRIRRLLPDAGNRLVCGTFHSLCKRQIQRAGERFVLANESQQLDLVRCALNTTIRERGAVEPVTLEQANTFIARLKSSCQPPFASSARDTILLETYKRYQQLMEQMGARDFADLVLLAVRGMKASSVEPWPVTHMLVDEYQDTDAMQYAWISLHARSGVIVTVVGDDDQSIYGWRNASGFHGMEKFHREHGAVHVNLGISYRCPREILEAASRLISYNNERVGKYVRSGSPWPGFIRVVRATSRENELKEVAETIRQQGKPGAWGILARNNEQLDGLERALTVKGVPYARSGGASFWESSGPTLFLDLCSSIANKNLIGIDRLLRKCGVSEVQLQRMHAKCDSPGAASLDRFLQVSTWTGKVSALHCLMRSWNGLIHEADIDHAMYDLAAFIKKHVRSQKEGGHAGFALKDHDQLKLCAQSISALRGSLGERLQALRQRDSRSEPDGDRARIMTLHASKGLEFANVWILGCEEGVLPSFRSDDLEEERRLFYVGMTRAKSHLVLSWVGHGIEVRSRFLLEAGL